MARTKMTEEKNERSMRQVMREGCQDLLQLAVEGKPAYIVTQNHKDVKFRLVAEGK